MGRNSLPHVFFWGGGGGKLGNETLICVCNVKINEHNTIVQVIYFFQIICSCNVQKEKPTYRETASILPGTIPNIYKSIIRSKFNIQNPPQGKISYNRSQYLDC